MKKHTTTKKRLGAAAIAVAGLSLSIAPSVAEADGHLTLAEILLADGNQFDTNQNDFDIVTEALLATDSINGLATAASSPGALTVFLPTDKAFRITVEDLLGVSIKNEAELFNAIVATLGVETVSAVLQYHVVPLEANRSTVVSLGDGFQVPTVLGPTIELDFKGKQIRLLDAGGPGRDPIVRVTDIEASNGVAHVIDRVLIPG